MADEQAVPETSPTPPEQPQPAAPEQAPAEPVTDPTAPQQPADPANPEAPVTPASDPAAPAEEAQGAAHQAFGEAHDVGYFGTNVDPRPNSDYSLESGPHAPSQLEQLRDAAQAQVDQLNEMIDSSRAVNQSQEG